MHKRQFKLVTLVILLALVFLTEFPLAQRQALGQGSPVPGASSALGSGGISPDGRASRTDSPAPGDLGSTSTYKMLPISVESARLRLEELKNLIALNEPQVVQDKVYAFCAWLADLGDAHNRLASVFSKQETLKAQALTEKATAQKFAHLKDEATLLKAELLIKQNRMPEAIGPLVEIATNEPKGSAGQAAYRRLKQIGFSEEPVENASTEHSADQILSAAKSVTKKP